MAAKSYKNDEKTDVTASDDNKESDVTTSNYFQESDVTTSIQKEERSSADIPTIVFTDYNICLSICWTFVRYSGQRHIYLHQWK